MAHLTLLGLCVAVAWLGTPNALVPRSHGNELPAPSEDSEQVSSLIREDWQIDYLTLTLHPVQWTTRNTVVDGKLIEWGQSPKPLPTASESSPYPGINVKRTWSTRYLNDTPRRSNSQRWGELRRVSIAGWYPLTAAALLALIVLAIGPLRRALVWWLVLPRRLWRATQPRPNGFEVVPVATQVEAAEDGGGCSTRT